MADNSGHSPAPGDNGALAQAQQSFDQALAHLAAVLADLQDPANSASTSPSEAEPSPSPAPSPPSEAAPSPSPTPAAAVEEPSPSSAAAPTPALDVDPAENEDQDDVPVPNPELQVAVDALSAAIAPLSTVVSTFRKQVRISMAAISQATSLSLFPFSSLPPRVFSPTPSSASFQFARFFLLRCLS